MLSHDRLSNYSERTVAAVIIPSPGGKFVRLERSRRPVLSCFWLITSPDSYTHESK